MKVGYLKSKVFLVILSVIFISVTVQAKKEKKPKSDKPVRGEVVDVSSQNLTFKTPKGEVVKVKIIAATDYSFVGFKGYLDDVSKPQNGFFVSVSRIDDGETIKAARFSPPFPPLKEISNKHELSADELFKIADENKDDSVTYLEYATHIYQSLKHGPGKFRKKMDKDGNGVVDRKEFSNSLNEFTWYRLSRKSAEVWFTEKDGDNNQELDLNEAKGLFRTHGDLEPVFKKYDEDKSGGISLTEYKKHWLEVVTGLQRQ